MNPRRIIKYTAGLIFGCLLMTANAWIDSGKDHVVNKFSMLPISYSGKTSTVERLSDSLFETLNYNKSLHLEDRFFSATHLFIEIAIFPEKTDEQLFFELNPPLSQYLGLNPKKYYSYSALLGVRSNITSLSNQSAISGLRLAPSNTIRIRILEQQLQEYEAVRSIFKFAWGKESFSEVIAELIESFPAGLEAYQNQLEGLPYDSNILHEHLTVRNLLQENKQLMTIVPSFRIHPESSQMISMESSILEFPDKGVFSTIPMRMAEFYDAFRQSNWDAANEALESIIENHTVRLAERKQEGSGKKFNPWFWFLKVISLLGVFVSILLSLIAMRGSSKAGKIAVMFSLTAWFCHLMGLWEYSIHEISYLSLPLLLSGFALLPLINLKYHYPPLLLANTLLAGTIILIQLKLPHDIMAFIAYDSLPLWLLIGSMLHQITMAFVIGLIWAATISSGITYWNLRKSKDSRSRFRELLNRTIPLIQIISIALLLSMLQAIILVLLTSGRFSLYTPETMTSLAIMVQCWLFLQLRWINQMNINKLLRFHLFTLILSILLLISLGDSLISFYPSTLRPNTLVPARTFMFIVAVVVIVASFLPDIKTSLQHWVRVFKTSRSSKK